MKNKATVKKVIISRKITLNAEVIEAQAKEILAPQIEDLVDEIAQAIIDEERVDDLAERLSGFRHDAMTQVLKKYIGKHHIVDWDYYDGDIVVTYE